MIGKLSGIIDSFDENFFILDVQGVGYQVHASRRTLSKIGQTGDPASVLIDTHVREDAITLYGFADAMEQQWYRLLTSVQGVGAKAGLSILSVCTSEQMTTAIMAEDKGYITQADGVGPKIATRIITELKDKVGKLSISQPNISIKYHEIREESEGSTLDSDAVSALINLGYSRSDAYMAVMKAKERANDNLQELIRIALKDLSA